MCLGSVLVLGWGSWTEVGECLCGFVWIIIRVLCGWATASTFVLLYADVCQCVHCMKGCAGSSSSIVPTSPYTLPSFLPFPPGCGQQTGQIGARRSRIRRDDLWSRRWWWLAWWKIKDRVAYIGPETSRHQRPCCAVLCHTSIAPLFTTPLKMTNALINCSPKLAATPWCSEIVCAPVHPLAFATADAIIYYVCHFSFIMSLIFLIGSVSSWKTSVIKSILLSEKKKNLHSVLSFSTERQNGNKQLPF